jgi:hypothetical protein
MFSILKITSFTTIFICLGFSGIKSTRFLVSSSNISGIPRHLSQYILKYHGSCLEFDEQDNLNKVDYQLLRDEFDQTKHEYKECEELSLFTSP